MKAGPLRHRVLLQTAVDTVDDTTGEPVRTWTNIGYWHCEISPISVREALIDGGVRDEADTWLRGHYSPEVARLRAKDRAVSEDAPIEDPDFQCGCGVSEHGTYYNLAGVPQIDNDRRRISLRVKSGLNDG